MIMRRYALTLLLATTTVAGCARNPVTGQRELALVSEAQEIEMGRNAAQQAAASIGLVDDQALQQYVQRIGGALAEDSERPNLPWSFQVVDDPSPNAFALPGGFIFVTRGLLSIMNNEAELASVIGHEIGHVTARHGVQQLSRAQLAQIGLGVGSILSPQVAELSGLASQGLQLLFLKYGRDAEYQADDLGFRYALEENYDVREMGDVFASLARASQMAGQSPLPTWLSSHPYPEDRIERNQQRLAALEQPLTQTVRQADDYARRISGLVYGENPRQGFFENGVFHHPDLRFRFSVPQGWRGQNLSQAVILMTEQQDAMFQLTLAGATQPAAALQQFLSQQGIAAGQAGTQSINGNPAAIGSFQAQTQDGGTLQGLAAFVSYGGNTYQMIGYAPAQRYPQYQRMIEATIASFGAETDPNVLNRQPQRLVPVKLDRAMTLGEFNSRYPSVVGIDELALINAVQATDRIPAGQWVKQVVERR